MIHVCRANISRVPRDNQFVAITSEYDNSLENLITFALVQL